MGLFDRIKRMFRTNIELSSSESIRHSSDSLLQSTQPLERPIEIPATPSTSTSYETPTTATIEKDSYGLGLAAGYTGHSIKSMESSISRIESQMATKDWTELKLKEHAEKYDQILQQRLARVEQALGIIQSTVSTGQQIPRQFTSRLPITPRMDQVVLAVKELKEVSYDDLAIRLDMNIDELRSLLAIMTKRTSVIERFRVGRRGWVRYKAEQLSE